MLDTWSRVCLGRDGAGRELPGDVPLVKVIGSCPAGVWSWPLGVLVLGLWGGTLPVTGPGNLFGTAKPSTVCGCLSWAGVSPGGTKLHQGHLLPALSLGQVREIPKAAPNLPPPADSL